MLLGVLGASLYVALWLMIWQHARTVLTHPPTQVADVAMVFGNRAYLNGAPNPCLTGRVDEGVRLADNGLANALLFSGGRDIEDNRVEAQVMETHARAQGYVGEVWREEASRSSLENMQLSAAIVSEKKARSVILVSEPYHLWRIQRLVERGYLGDVELAKVGSFEAALLAFADREHAELLQQINQTGAYNDEIEAKLKGILDTFKATQSW